MSLDQNTLAFMRLRNRGYIYGDFIQGQFAQQNEDLNGQRELAMRALRETQNANTTQTNSLIGRVQDPDVLAPANEYVNALESRIKELQDFKETGQDILTEQEAVLAERRELQSGLNDTLKVLQRELAFPHDPIEDAISGYGERASKNIAGWRDPPGPPYYYNG
jgi:DNA repair exonuclease SbcCD ATPase subunit